MKFAAILAAGAAFAVAVSAVASGQTPTPSATAVVTGDAFDAFAVSDETSTRHFSYEVADDFVKKYSVTQGGRARFYYGSMAPEGVAFLDRYTDALATIDPTTLNKNEQLAYWLNLRNVLVLRSIAKERPRRSMKDARGEVSAPGEMWTTKRLSVKDVPVSIDDIERRIILRQFHDPNVIFGMYQGAEGGPAYPSVSYVGSTVTDELKAAGQRFVAAKGAIKVKKGAAEVAPYLYWHKAAFFGDDDAAFRAFVGGLAEPSVKTALDGAASFAPGKFDYGLDEIEIRQQPVQQQYQQQPQQPSYSGSGS